LLIVGAIKSRGRRGMYPHDYSGVDRTA
jgi:hypothetical protein